MKTGGVVRVTIGASVASSDRDESISFLIFLRSELQSNPFRRGDGGGAMAVRGEQTSMDYKRCFVAALRYEVQSI